VANPFWHVVRWTSVVLIGIAIGSVAITLGYGSMTLLLGAIALFVGAVFVGASIWATYLSPLFSEPSVDSTSEELVGPGLVRATFLGFLGAGILVGSVSGNEIVGVLSGVTGGITILLSLGAGPAEQRDPR
jgi:hypothetical protein